MKLQQNSFVAKYLTPLIFGFISSKSHSFLAYPYSSQSRDIARRKIIIFTLIVGFLMMPLPVFANSHACSITPFNFRTGITPTRFQAPSDITTAIKWCDLLQIASNVIGLLSYIVIPIAILMVTFGGLIILTSGGDEKRLKKGQGFIKSALIGALIALGAGLLISLLLRALGVTNESLFPWLF